ncbi:hypothetical protein L6259_01130 [Candidatus Parcubacteria bacterium]|nr:hypothetical protein [Candidatus Parcubacteria bacterium]
MDIVGNRNITSFLEKATENKMLAHSYIFCGPRSIGKKTTAYWLASKLLNIEKERLHLHPDFMEARPGENNIQKEEVDKIISRLSLSAFSGGYKILIINHAELLNTSSANALLKTLEEPSKNTLIMILTSEVGKLLPTIISRSALLQFKLVPKKEVREFLKDKGQDAKECADASCGRPGRAIKMMAQDWKQYQNDSVEEFYNLFCGDISGRLKISSALFKDKENGKRFILEKIESWAEIIRDVFLLKYGLSDEIIHKDSINTLKAISKSKKISQISILLARIIKMRGLLRQNINSQLMLENLII